MSETQEKDNFWLWIGALIIGTVVLVGMLKARETEHLTKEAVSAQAADMQKFDQRKTRNVTAQ